MQREVIRYSEAFKIKVVDDLEQGRYGSPFEASRAYGIKGVDTVRRWARQYGKNHLVAKVVRVEKPEERDELKRLKQKIKALEKALGDSETRSIVNQSYFELLCEDLKIDPEIFKKKNATDALIKRMNIKTDPDEQQ